MANWLIKINLFLPYQELKKKRDFKKFLRIIFSYRFLSLDKNTRIFSIQQRDF